MAHEGLHEDRKNLKKKTRDMHRALVSLQEELEAVDWYRQRVDACDDKALKDILAHNMGEEMEHAAMIIEWLRRQDSQFATQLRTYLFTDIAITGIEEIKEAEQATQETGAQSPPVEEAPRIDLSRVCTIGSLKE